MNVLGYRWSACGEGGFCGRGRSEGLDAPALQAVQLQGKGAWEAAPEAAGSCRQRGVCLALWLPESA